jgi:PAS domain S-box-containing protein
MADQVQRSLERYRELFENAADFVYTADLNGRFMTVNKAAETISGYNRDELLRKTFADLMVPADAELWRLNQNEISADALNTVSEIHILSKDGKSVSLEDNRRPIFENGVLSGIQGVARDLTERNRIKERLDLSNRMEAIGRLAGGIAHDFGNVLTIITGYCTLLRKSIKPDDPLQAEVEGIQKATQRAVSMIRHLLSFSRGQIVNPTLLTLDKAISETTSVLRRLIGDKIALVTKVEPRIGHVRMDPTQFEQVLVNLALNARDSMPQGGRIQIEVVNEDVLSPETNNKDGLPPGPYIRLSLTDTGCGMPPDVLSRIFEPFFSTKTQGTGLGLSSVYSIVRQAGGQISAESQPGAGTTMTIHLPRVLEMEAEAERQTPTRLGRNNETILLVEDEVDVRRFVREMLQNEGYHVVEAIDQSHAIAVCGRAEEHIDLVLTDVVMPDMSGPELADRLRGLRPGLKVLFMSGYARDRFEKHRKRGEAIHFIQKPLSSKTLSEKVRGILDANS